MAYATVNTVTRQGDQVRVTISETDAAAASESSAIETGQKYLTLLSQAAILSSGTGATIDPRVGTKTGFAKGDGLSYETGTAAAAVLNNNVLQVMNRCYTADGKLYHRSTVNAGTNNAITTEYLFKIGW